MGGGQNRWRANIRVAPDVRGRGLGTQMLERLEAHARAKGAPKLQGAVRGEEAEGLRFATKHGYREFHRRFDSYLDVSTFDASRFEDPKEIAARAGVRIDRYDTLEAEAPDRVAFQRSAYESLSTTAGGFRPEPPPPPLRSKRCARYFEKARLCLTRPSSRCAMAGVGTSITIIDPEGVAYTVYTGVDRAERGSGHRACDEAPDPTPEGARHQLFGTTNDEANAPMRASTPSSATSSPPTIEVEKVLRAVSALEDARPTNPGEELLAGAVHQLDSPRRRSASTGMHRSCASNERALIVSVPVNDG
jgi:hypothetical protein